MHRTIQVKARNLLADAKVPIMFWPEAVRTATRPLNWLSHSSIELKRPIDRWLTTMQF